MTPELTMDAFLIVSISYSSSLSLNLSSTYSPPFSFLSASSSTSIELFLESFNFFFFFHASLSSYPISSILSYHSPSPLTLPTASHLPPFPFSSFVTTPPLQSFS